VLQEFGVEQIGLDYLQSQTTRYRADAKGYYTLIRTGKKALSAGAPKELTNAAKWFRREAVNGSFPGTLLTDES
jgi:hypothetical protein